MRRRAVTLSQGMVGPSWPWTHRLHARDCMYPHSVTDGGGLRALALPREGCWGRARGSHCWVLMLLGLTLNHAHLDSPGHIQCIHKQHGKKAGWGQQARRVMAGAGMWEDWGLNVSRMYFIHAGNHQRVKKKRKPLICKTDHSNVSSLYVFLKNNNHQHQTLWSCRPNSKN